MISEIQRLLDTYVAWLKDKSTLTQVDDWVVITSPYLDRHNDYLQIYVRRHDGEYVLTDDGYVLEDLGRSGCYVETERRRALLTMTINGFGVHLNKNALEVTASPENFALRKHNLVQAMLAVNDLFCLAAPMVASVFYEDVVAWLDLHDIRYIPHIKFAGSSGYDHLFDFVIPKSRTQPERIARTINRPNRDTAQSLIFSWFDTREARSPEAKAYAVLNDSEQPVQSPVLAALQNYKVTPFLWSKRDQFIQEFAS